MASASQPRQLTVPPTLFPDGAGGCRDYDALTVVVPQQGGQSQGAAADPRWFVYDSATGVIATDPRETPAGVYRVFDGLFTSLWRPWIEERMGRCRTPPILSLVTL